MTAFNIVRFRVKPGRDQEFIDVHRNANAEGFTGARRFALIKSGDNTYCVIGEWESIDHIVEARPRMISLLDIFRDCLEDLGGDLGVTDPVSGEAILEAGPPARKVTRRAGGARRKPATKGRATSARPAKPRAKAKAGAKPAGRKPAKRAKKKAAAKRARR